jgi:hypothetical protein
MKKTSKPRQLKLEFELPLMGDVCKCCNDAVTDICYLCRRCPACGHARGCSGEFVDLTTGEVDGQA